jgi:hypothetical protein
VYLTLRVVEGGAKRKCVRFLYVAAKMALSSFVPHDRQGKAIVGVCLPFFQAAAASLSSLEMRQSGVRQMKVPYNLPPLFTTFTLNLLLNNYL